MEEMWLTCLNKRNQEVKEKTVQQKIMLLKKLPNKANLVFTAKHNVQIMGSEFMYSLGRGRGKPPPLEKGFRE